jgi:hypothetical protein
MSQTVVIENYLKRTKRGLTAKEARLKFGCDRLSARIYDIKSRFQIERVMEQVVKSDGSFAHVARYFILKTKC